MTQGERVLEIRKSLNLTLDKFGEKIGIQSSAVSKIEKGKVNLSEQTAKAICREYNVNYDYLVNGEGEMFDNLPQTVLDELCLQYNLDDLDREIVNMYISLPEPARAAVKAYIKKIVGKEK